MTCCVDLRKFLRLCGAGFMALSAQHACVQLCGLNRGIVGVRRERAVTGFAIYRCMFAGPLFVGDVCVAGFASLMTGEMHRFCSEFGE